MKLRILAREMSSGTENIILCSDGFYTEASEENLKYIFSHISHPEMLHGDGDMPWELIYDTMEEYPGKALAWIDDDCVLRIRQIIASLGIQRDHEKNRKNKSRRSIPT